MSRKALILTLALLIGLGLPDLLGATKPLRTDSGKIYRMEIKFEPDVELSRSARFKYVFHEVNYDPADMTGLLIAVTRATEVAPTLTTFNFSIPPSAGGCGAASKAVGQEMFLVLPEGWRVRQIRSLNRTQGGGSTDQTTLLSSPSGNHYLLDTSKGAVEVARMIVTDKRIRPEQQSPFENLSQQIRTTPSIIRSQVPTGTGSTIDFIEKELAQGLFPLIEGLNPVTAYNELVRPFVIQIEPGATPAPGLVEQIIGQIRGVMEVPIFSPAPGEEFNVYLFHHYGGLRWEPSPAGFVAVCLLPKTKKSVKVQPVIAIDPNDKVGSQGVAPLKSISGEERLRYAISELLTSRNYVCITGDS